MFVNFVDHGAPGLVAFPNGVVSYILYLYVIIFCETFCKYLNIVPTSVAF